MKEFEWFYVPPGEDKEKSIKASGITATEAVRTTLSVNDAERRIKGNVEMIEDVVRAAASRGERKVTVDFQKKVNLRVLEAVGLEFLERGFHVDLKAATRDIKMTLSWGHLS